MDMKLISWNVNGFRSCLGKGFADFFASQDADFFSIQETKMQPGQADFAPEGYRCYWYSAEKKGYSGTAVFAKTEPLSVRYGLGIEEHDHEGRAITLEYEDFYLLNVYTPNAQRELARLDYRMAWEDALRAYITELDKTNPVIYCGDLNVAHEEIDLKNPRPTTRAPASPTRKEGSLPTFSPPASPIATVPSTRTRWNIPGGAICTTQGKRTWAGVSTILLFPTA